MLKKHGEIEVGVGRVCGVKPETPNIPSLSASGTHHIVFGYFVSRESLVKYYIKNMI
jgi:hypothetical protein